jgi:hypothetical protein
LTYGDFRRTGVQDCGNVMSIDEFDFKGGGTAEQIVARTWAEWEDDGMEEQWLEQQDDLEGLDPHQCYEAWRDGWKSCATRVVGYELIDRAKRAEDDEEHDNPPAGWWRKPAPRLDRPCYRTKSEALKKFLDVNYAIVENYGGADYEVSPSEFDAINHKYDLTGKKAARTIAQAVWASMPVGKPYCLDRIDIEALNDTSPAREAGLAFRLPDVVHETAMAEAEARHYAPEEPEPAWVTERETPRSPALPPMPIRLQLEEREPGVETYQMFSNPPRKPPMNAAEMNEIIHEAGGVDRFFGAASGAVSMQHVRRAVGRSKARQVELVRHLNWLRETGQDVEGIKPYRLHLEDREPGVETYSIKSNPAWVTNILSKHFVKLEEQVPPQWLPKLTATKASRGRISATMKEYGCGAYGCVLPTLDPKVVLKLTTDETEAQFAHEMADKLTAPVVVKYHLARALPEKYKGRPSFLLWRDSADHVGKVEQAIAEEGGTNPTVVEEAISAQHRAAQEAFDALHEGRDARKLIQKWEDAAREMGLMVPELKELAEGMITNLHKDKVFFGDVHAGNIGLVNGHWVVVDPGHVAVLEGP